MLRSEMARVVAFDNGVLSMLRNIRAPLLNATDVRRKIVVFRTQFGSEISFLIGRKQDFGSQNGSNMR